MSEYCTAANHIVPAPKRAAVGPRCYGKPRSMLLPNWPRLMSIELAAAYLSRSPTIIRERGPAPKRDGRSVLYDRADLDRWADQLGGQPLRPEDREKEAKEVERRFLEKRRGQD